MKTFVLDALLPWAGLWTIRFLHLPLERSRHCWRAPVELVPALWHLEIANGLVAAERRGILTSSDAMLALLQLEQLCAQALAVEAEMVRWFRCGRRGSLITDH